MPDRIQLVGIRARGRHGVFPQERRDGQTFVVDVELRVDSRPAAAADDLTQTVDYSTVAADVVAVITGDPVDLIETVAERIASGCLTREGVRSVRVAVHKPEAPVGQPVDDVVVVIERERTP